MTHDRAVATHAAERYLLDEMPELERFQFEEHYFDCAECADTVRLGGVMQDGVAAGLLPAITAATAPAAVHEPSTSRASGGSMGRLLPWAVAATLALATGYQTLVVVPGLRDQAVGPQALAPLTLRAASRGAVPTLVRPTSGVVSFALDVNGIAAGTRLAYDLRAADGTSVATGSAAAPPPGAPLLLLVPASAFPSEGSYTLSVAAAEGGRVVADYRFTLTEQ